MPLIQNDQCPYCRCTLSPPGNEPASRTAEHLVPHAVLDKKRGKDEADFYACKKCNSKKSAFDRVTQILLLLTGGMNNIEKLRRVIDDPLCPFWLRPNSIALGRNAPVIGIDCSKMKTYAREYGNFLAKGLYFLQKCKVLDPKEKVIIVDYIDNLQFAKISTVEPNVFAKLRRNPDAETIQYDCATILKEHNEFLVVFRDTFGFGLKVGSRLFRKNVQRASKSPFVQSIGPRK